MKEFIVKSDGKQFKVKATDYESAIAAVRAISAKDEATQLDIIQALVTDEQAAIAAYTNAIANLDGKVDPQYLEVLRNILKEENKHVENLQAIITGNVTEKNVEDSVKDDSFWSDIKSGEHVYIEYRDAGRRLATLPGKTVFKGREGGMIVINMNGKELRIPENAIVVRAKDSK